MAGLDILQSMLNPTYQADQATIDRQTAMANALMQNAMTPREGQMVSGHYIAPGLGGIDRLAAAFASNKLANQANDERTTNGRRYAAALQGALGSSPTDGQQAVQQAQPPVDSNAILNAPAGGMGDALAQVGAQATQLPQPVQTTPQFSNQPQGNNFALGNLIKGAAIGQVGGDQAAGAYWKQYDPTDATKMAMAAGVDPKQANADALTKSNRIAPVPLRSGAGYLDSNNIYHTTPSAPAEGYMNVPDSSSPTGFKVVASNGALPAIQNSSYAKTAGGKGYTTGNGVGSTPSNMPPGVPSTFGPTSDASISAFGAGQTQQLADMDKKWTTQQQENRNAQTTNSYLENIGTQAEKAAIGPGSDKKEFVNGLLSFAGISDKATDAVTANALMSKYESQIVMRLSQAGMNTDAARELAQAGTPGAHMNLPAIKEAVGNLVGAGEMTKARTSLLAPYASKRDAVGYQEKEIIFDQNADPRLWQYKKIAGTPQGKQFLQTVLQQDPQFLQKAQALHQIGAY